MDWVVSDELSLTIGNVVGWVSAGAMILGGVIPYVPQYRQIKNSQDSDGFSLYVCLALLVANTLRIFFWFGKRFEYPLLIQSIIMNITMLAMIHLCVRVRNKNRLVQGRSRVFSELDAKYFWAWTDFQSYLDCVVIFAIICAIIMYFMISISWFVEMVGFLAVFTEAMLGVPQLARNYKSQSTVGMSYNIPRPLIIRNNFITVTERTLLGNRPTPQAEGCYLQATFLSVSMVIMWTCGDIFKTIYFLIREAPAQFWICGAMQVTVDVAILFQVRWYRLNTDMKNPAVHRVD